MKQFKDKVVLITGSSQGIGKATAMAFSRLGAKVVLNGRNLERLRKTEKELQQAGAVVQAFQGDITREDEARSLVEKTIQRFGKLDILINNAGISMRGHFATLKPEVFRTVFNTNVLGVANLAIPAMPHIRESKGSIIFVSSVAGIRGLPGISAYCASKMALRGIAESIRIEEASTGIHVGLMLVGQTEIEFGKQTISANGNLVTINDRSGFKVATKESVARAIVQNVKHRQFITTLTGFGKLNAIMQSIAPGLVEKILISQSDRIMKRS
ncbi:MAG: SDR family oxidoreductase [Cyclobacteriaceae bacterium]|nr:SDR family oxidoreductase [Cyclobacteriaceae bacterium]MDH4297979.1 SDR family oxidoreductase [Cyclobacteriaceae bacterium]MDH5251214.1 SDR family oxidoreductase [Cyclobacteriaceae bacterium]